MPAKRLKSEEMPEKSYFMSEDKSDVVFVIDGKRLPAHKLILGLKSQVFNAMFCGEFKERETIKKCR